MKSVRMSVKRVLLDMLISAGITSPALAMDPVCAQLKAANVATMAAPFHLYINETETIAPNLAAAAKTIGMGGTKKSEEISTGKNLYILIDGKWIDMQMSFSDMQDGTDDDLEEQKGRKCQTLPDETVFGQTASVFNVASSSFGGQSQTKFWVSKRTHLVLRSDSTIDVDKLKKISTTRYEYTDVLAPQGATTMKDLSQKKVKR